MAEDIFYSAYFCRC